MEEVAALVIQLVVEVGLQLFGSIGFDFLTESRRVRSDEDRDGGRGWLLVFAVFGGVCGGLSLVVRPDLILPTFPLRAANLLISPLVAGGLSYLVAAHVWAPRGASAWHHFWRGFWFALAFGLVRFAYAHR